MKDGYDKDANVIRNTSPISRRNDNRETAGSRNESTSPAPNSEQENKTQLPGSTVDEFDW